MLYVRFVLVGTTEVEDCKRKCVCLIHALLMFCLVGNFVLLKLKTAKESMCVLYMLYICFFLVGAAKVEDCRRDSPSVPRGSYHSPSQCYVTP